VGKLQPLILLLLFDTGTALSLTGAVVPSASTLQFKTAGFNALISKLDNDSRFNSVSRPTLRVKTGITAKFNVGSQVPILGNATLDKNGNPVQSIDYKPSGTIFTVTPDIRGDVIDLEIHQELSSFVLTTTGVNNSPTLIQRTANSTLSLHENEIVAFAGLEEDTDNETSRKLFGFIPISTTKSKNTTEILLFIYAEKIQP
jgi:type II secretory pathway component GspD/PulD (secretin)